MEKLIKLREERAGLVKKAREIQGEAEKREKPELSAEERTQIDRIMTDVRELTQKLQDEETLQAAEGENRAASGQNPGEEQEAVEMRSFRKFITSGESRGLVAGTVTEGGALAPQQFYDRLFQDIDAQFPLFNRCDVVTIRGAGSLGAPQLTADVSDPDWTAEVPANDIEEDTDLGFSLRTLTPSPLTKLVKISRRLVNAAAIDPDGLVRRRLAYKNAKALENGMFNGDGIGKALGIYTVSASGVPASRDVIGTSATGITYEDVVRTKRKVSSKYKDKIWLCHEDFVTACMLLKDNNGRPLWVDGFASGEPARICGLPYYESEVAPNTFAANQYVAAVADLNYYLWAVSGQVEIQVLMELFRLKNQTGYLSYLEADGSPVVPEAFARLKLAA